LKHLVQTGRWDIVAVSRRTPDVEGTYEHLAADLADQQTASGTCHA